MIKTTTIIPEMCECGRLYKDRRNEQGKMMCSACYIGLSVDDLKKLWGTQINSSQAAEKINSGNLNDN
jgi:hypothetical protein